MTTHRLAEDSPDSVDVVRPRFIADRYEIKGLVGIGGMGSVYRVYDRELDVVVALKFLHVEALGERNALERFRDEAKLARRVSHVNVARTFDIGEHDGQKFLTMEFIDGEPLSRMLEREGSLPLARVADLARQICAGLGAAHAAGVVHQDLKPENVLIERGGRVVISDFGIARELRPSASETRGPIIGTVAYMAPEQLEGGPVDARSDLYALGAVLYEMLTGAKAWSAASAVEVAMRRLHEPPPDPRTSHSELPASIAAIVLRCMARAKEDRFATAAELSAAVELAEPDALAKTQRFDAMPVAARAFRVAPSPRAHATTVAVLPFANLGAPEDDFLANELTDELIDALSMTGGLRVRPRRVVEHHAAADLQELARALDVQVVVEGTVRRAVDRVWVSARVIGVAEGLQIWARRFDRPASDLLSANEEIARAVAEVLATSVQVHERQAGADNGIAAELYLRARGQLRIAWGGMGDIDLAVELFRQGLARAPDDGGLLSGFAMARARRYNYKGGDDAEVRAIRELAEHAISRAPHLGEPWQTLATLSYVTSEWPDAVRSLRRALHLAPGLLRAHEALAHIEVESGRIEEGLFRLETVLSLDPTPSMGRVEAIRANGLLRRWDRVDELLALSVDDEADRLMNRLARARMGLWRGNFADPIVTEQEAGDNPYLLLTRAHGVVAYERVLPAWCNVELVAMIAHLGTTAPRSRLRPLLAQFRAELCAAAGERESALAAVGEAVRAELYDRAWLDLCPLLDPLRSDPSWPSLVRPVEERTSAILAALGEPIT